MKQYESEHYLFHYNEHSTAERDLSLIVQTQEACFRYICDVLRVEPDYKLNYFLCETPEEVARVYGDCEPCNGFAYAPDKIYAVYNDKTRCIGFHEDAHLVSWLIAHNESPAVKEGLAMYFDRKWWNIPNQEWVAHYLKTGRYEPVSRLLDMDYFYSTDCSLSYPVMGAFTDWLISSFGMDRYLAFYRTEGNPAEVLQSVYGKTPEEMDSAFTGYIRLFGTDPAVEARIKDLLQEAEIL